MNKVNRTMLAIHFITSKLEKYFVNPFAANVLILYPLKTQEHHWFSVVFRRVKMGT